jgi:hypothetical protein
VIVETIEHEDKRIVIETDDFAESPRNWDNIGTISAFHRKYDLADKGSADTIEEVEDIESSPDYISLPIYMYEHGGICVSTSPFSCPWDSGKLGIIYVSRSTLEKEGLGHKGDEDIEKLLQGEIDVWDDYLRGNVFGYKVLDEDDEIIDSCWGFYGYDHEESGLLEQARG